MTTSPSRCPHDSAARAGRSGTPSARAARSRRPAPGVLVGVAVVATLLTWASAFVAIRAVGSTFGPGPMALLRLLAGTLTLTGFVLVRGGGRWPVMPARSSMALIAGYGVAWFAGYTVALNAAERHLDAGTAAMLVNIAPILVALVAGRLLREGYPRPLLIGIAVSFTGVAIIAGGGSGGSDRVGLLLGLVTAVLYTAGVLVQKVALRRVDGLTATWLGCAVGTVVLLPFAPGAYGELAAASWPAIAAVAYLGVFPTAVGFALWAYALARVDAGALAATTLAVPAIVVVMSWGLLGELPALSALAGGALCLVGVAVSRARSRAGTRPDPAGEVPAPTSPPAPARNHHGVDPAR